MQQALQHKVKQPGLLMQAEVKLIKYQVVKNRLMETSLLKQHVLLIKDSLTDINQAVRRKIILHQAVINIKGINVTGMKGHNKPQQEVKKQGIHVLKNQQGLILHRVINNLNQLSSIVVLKETGHPQALAEMLSKQGHREVSLQINKQGHKDNKPGRVLHSRQDKELHLQGKVLRRSVQLLPEAQLLQGVSQAAHVVLHQEAAVELLLPEVVAAEVLHHRQEAALQGVADRHPEVALLQEVVLLQARAVPVKENKIMQKSLDLIVLYT